MTHAPPTSTLRTVRPLGLAGLALTAAALTALPVGAALAGPQQ